jgi:hypothetical protein
MIRDTNGPWMPQGCMDIIAGKPAPKGPILIPIHGD